MRRKHKGPSTLRELLAVIEDDLLAHFRIFPRLSLPRLVPRGLYFVVSVFKTKHAMLRFCREHCAHAWGTDMAAICHSFAIQRITKDSTQTLPCIGSIHMYKKRVTPQVIAHECTHAAMAWLRQVRKMDTLVFPIPENSSDVSSQDELLCQAVGDLCMQCNRKLYETGVWK